MAISRLSSFLLLSFLLIHSIASDRGSDALNDSSDYSSSDVDSEDRSTPFENEEGDYQNAILGSFPLKRGLGPSARRGSDYSWKKRSNGPAARKNGGYSWKKRNENEKKKRFDPPVSRSNPPNYSWRKRSQFSKIRRFEP